MLPHRRGQLPEEVCGGGSSVRGRQQCARGSCGRDGRVNRGADLALWGRGCVFYLRRGRERYGGAARAAWAGLGAGGDGSRDGGGGGWGAAQRGGRPATKGLAEGWKACHACAVLWCAFPCLRGPRAGHWLACTTTTHSTRLSVYTASAASSLPRPLVGWRLRQGSLFPCPRMLLPAQSPSEGRRTYEVVLPALFFHESPARVRGRAWWQGAQEHGARGMHPVAVASTLAITGSSVAPCQPVLY